MHDLAFPMLPAPSGGSCSRWRVDFRRRRGLAGRLRSELREDRPQGADARRQRIAVVVDGTGQKGHEGGGFIVRKVKVLHGPDMGSRCPVAKAEDLAALSLLAL